LRKNEKFILIFSAGVGKPPHLKRAKVLPLERIR
jgi:hypothetical protein